VAGRLIATLKPAGRVDFNYVSWDGRDEDGEAVANGTYLFRIDARSGSETVRSDIGRIVRLK